MPRPSKNTKRFKNIVRFLVGEEQLDGRWIGDDPPLTKTGRRRTYWWRSELRDTTEKLLYELWLAKEQASEHSPLRRQKAK